MGAIINRDSCYRDPGVAPSISGRVIRVIGVRFAVRARAQLVFLGAYPHVLSRALDSCYRWPLTRVIEDQNPDNSQVN